MSILSILYKTLTLAVILFAGVLVGDYTGMDRELGPAYHKHVKGKLVEKEILRNRSNTASNIATSKKEEASTAKKENIVIRAIKAVVSFIIRAVINVVLYLAQKAAFALMVLFILTKGLENGIPWLGIEKIAIKGARKRSEDDE